MPRADPSLAVCRAIVPAPSSFLRASSFLHPSGPWDFFTPLGPAKENEVSPTLPTQSQRRDPSQGGRCLCPFRLRETTQTKKGQGKSGFIPRQQGGDVGGHFLKKLSVPLAIPAFLLGDAPQGLERAVQIQMVGLSPASEELGRERQVHSQH